MDKSKNSAQCQPPETPNFSNLINEEKELETEKTLHSSSQDMSQLLIDDISAFSSQEAKIHNSQDSKNKQINSSSQVVMQQQFKQKRIKKPKLKQKRLIPEKKIYFVAGDVFVEIEESKDEVLNSEIFNEFRNIRKVEVNKSVINIELESVRPLKMLNQVVYQLESSQNQENYNFAQVMKRHQNTIFAIQDMMQSVINSYEGNSSELEDLLRKREKFMLEEKNKVLQKCVSNDEFCCVGSLTLSFSNLTTTISHMSVTRPSVAMIGGDDQQILQHFLRKGFINLFNYASRKILFRLNMESQNLEENFMRQFGIPREFVFEVPYFEICTLDDIKISCSTTIMSSHIKYPENLQFSGQTVYQLNNIESFFIVRYNITSDHIINILKLRREREFKHFQSQFKENLEVSDLEYFVKTSIFVEKHYKQEYDELEKQRKNLQLVERRALYEATVGRCGYRKIGQN